MSSLIYLPCNIKFTYKNISFFNKEMNKNIFLKGGCAREALMAYMTGDRNPHIYPRDLDMWVPDWFEDENGDWDWEKEEERWVWDWEELNECPLMRKFYLFEDSRGYEDGGLEPYGVASTLLENRVDVNLNKVLVGQNGLYAHEDAVKGILNREVKRDCPLKAPKRAIRAYLMALRYNYSVDHSLTYLPWEPHSYYLVAMKKANQLGILHEWIELLLNFKVWVYYKEALKIYGQQEEDIPLIVVEEK